MKKVLICGATGFIGRNLAERFASNPEYDVTATYNVRPVFNDDRIRFVHADLTQRKDVERVVDGADLILQAAATTSGSGDIIRRPHIHITDNAVLNSLLFRAAHDAGVGQVVFLSCSIMYSPSETPVKECDLDLGAELHPAYFAGAWNKIYFEKMAEFYAGQGRTRFLVIRHSNIYGPYDKFDLEKSHVFGATVAKVYAAKNKIVVWGTGEEGRDLLYVSDLVDFIEGAVERVDADFEIFNVGSGRSLPIGELVRKIIDVSGRSLEIAYDPGRPTIKTTVCLDCGKAKQQLGWWPRVGIEEGIRRTLEWYGARVD